jgi:putative hydrolase of the HAD superfamily
LGNFKFEVMGEGAFMIEAIIFDLDDTLYPENEFVLSGYRAVARETAGGGKCEYKAAFDCMRTALHAAGRKAVFPALLARFPGLGVTLEDMVRIYREHVPEISLFPGYGPLLEELGKKYRLGIITDGLPAVQRGKVRALGIEKLFEKIIYSWDYGEDRQKPHLYPFALMLDALGIPPQSALFVGDNPEKDGRGARGAGMIYVRAAPPAGGPSARMFPDEAVMENLLQLPRILLNYNGF